MDPSLAQAKERVVEAAEVARVAVAIGSVTTVESVGGADVTGVRSG